MEGEDHVQCDEEVLSSDEAALPNSQDSSSSYETSSEADSGQQNGSPYSLQPERQNQESNSSDILGRPSKVPQGTPQRRTSEAIASGYPLPGIDPSGDAAEAGETSRGEVEASPKSDSRRTAAKKRKADKLSAGNKSAKRLKGVSIDDYRQLLNKDIQDADSHLVQEDYDALPQSQLGCSTWTSAEKNAFFTALARLGRDNVRGIASRIESKSELEVQEYIQLLHQGLLEKSLNEARQELIRVTDIPAAVQISKECCDMLERAADALAFRQERHEEQEEQSKWGESWLLTTDVNASIEEHLAEEGGSQKIREVLQAAELLNLRNWLELSARVFMNPAAPREDENWQFLAGVDEEPAIRATAFTDFHRLAISITKRLVSATLFCTMSRLRATDSKAFNRNEIIRSADVQAATKMIGLEINRNEFWISCPKRCNLKVFKTISSTSRQQVLEYDEVETLLTRRGRSASQSPFLTRGIRQQSSSIPSAIAQDGLPHSASVVSQLDANSNINPSVEPSDGESDNSDHEEERMPKKIKLKDEAEQAHQEYAEAFDMQASLIEEQKLWDIMNQHPPFAIKPDSVELPRKPKQEREEFNEIDNWRQYMQYRSEWETHATPVPSSTFLKLKTTRRQRSRPAPQREDGGGDESSENGLAEEKSDDGAVDEGSELTGEEAEESVIQDGDTTSDEGSGDDDDDVSDTIEMS